LVFRLAEDQRAAILEGAGAVPLAVAANFAVAFLPAGDRLDDPLDQVLLRLAVVADGLLHDRRVVHAQAGGVGAAVIPGQDQLLLLLGRHVGVQFFDKHLRRRFVGRLGGGVGGA